MVFVIFISVKFQVGNSQAVLGAVFLVGEHISELGAVADQVTDPFSVLAVSLVALLELGIFGMREGNKTVFSRTLKIRDPVLARRFHTDFRAIVIGKPCSQVSQPFGERRKTCLFILGNAVRVGNANAGIDPSFYSKEK